MSTSFRIPAGLKALAPKSGSRYAISGADFRPEPDQNGSALISLTDGRALAVLTTEAESLAANPVAPEARRLRLRADELAAGLDAWTGGWFSAHRNALETPPEPTSSPRP